MTFSEPELQSLLKEWQKTLRMQDWDFKLSVVKQYDIPNEAQAWCKFVLAKRATIIKILHPDDYDPSTMGSQDMEKSLVHEMLHPLMAQFESGESNTQGTMEWIAKEQVIDFIAQALVGLKRRAEIVPAEPERPEITEYAKNLDSGGNNRL